MSDLLYLRIPRSEDVDFMLRLENDPDIWKVSQTEEPFTYDEIADFINDSKHNLFLEFQLRNVIVLKEGDTAIGTLDLFDYDDKERSAGIGITICKDYRNKKIGSKALLLFVKMAFLDLNIRELYCTIFPDNIESISLFESCGFQREKLLKNNVQYRGQSYDVYLYRLKKEDIYEERN